MWGAFILMGSLQYVRCVARSLTQRDDVFVSSRYKHGWSGVLLFWAAFSEFNSHRKKFVSPDGTTRLKPNRFCWSFPQFLPDRCSFTRNYAVREQGGSPTALTGPINGPAGSPEPWPDPFGLIGLSLGTEAPWSLGGALPGAPTPGGNQSGTGEPRTADSGNLLPVSGDSERMSGAAGPPLPLVLLLLGGRAAFMVCRSLNAPQDGAVLSAEVQMDAALTGREVKGQTIRKLQGIIRTNRLIYISILVINSILSKNANLRNT